MGYLDTIHLLATQSISHVTKNELAEEITPGRRSLDETVKKTGQCVLGLVIVINITQHWDNVISGIIILFKKVFRKKIENIVKRSYASVKKPTPATRTIFTLNQNEEFSISL